MLRFSDRYGYTTPPSVLITEDMPKEVENAICSVFDDLRNILDKIYDHRVHVEYKDEGLTYSMLELMTWRNFLHNRKDSLKFRYGKCQEVITEYMQSKHTWYEKLNLLEYILTSMYEYAIKHDDYYIRTYNTIVKRLNVDFENLLYGYRIINNEIVPITDQLEIESVQNAVESKNDNVHIHIETALAHFAKRPEPDYRNSIKESISAVECLCRAITKKSTLDDAIPVLKSKGIQLNPQFEEGLKKMYFYTNDKRTGIRHALMDDKYIPTMADAKYMLVVCSAFVNYIRALMPDIKTEELRN